jgi:hypothetical protein
MTQLVSKLKKSKEAQPLPSQWQLLQEFDYDNRTGLLYRKNKKTNIFRPAGTINPTTGRYELRLNLKRYIQSRIIYKMHTGEEPPIVDHIDGNKINNRFENLRAATRSQNQHNRKTNLNTNAYKNISWHKAAKKWHIQIRANNKTVVSVLTEDLELAKLVAIEGRDKYHGQYARHQ